ncbi:MAG: sugar phosphate isomerase/epimerase [Pirellulales bacterium]|nr:sugar phosphate isomerase/epimerase [Pirellulales bacterium]
MKYGMNLLLWTGNVTSEHLPLCEKLASMGFDGVELPIFSPDETKFTQLGKRLDDLGLGRTAVTVRNEPDNPISSDPAIRAAGIAATKAVLDSCAAAGVEILAGPIHSALGVFSGSGRTDEEWLWGVESIREVAEYADQLGVTLAIEAVNRFECYFINTMGDAARFAREVDHPRCRVMYDSFHANIEEKRIGKAIECCADVLGHVHISENDRSTPGQGNVRWNETFDALRTVDYDGWLVVEAFGFAVPELVAATKIWRPMFVTEEQLATDALQFMKEQVAQRWME